MKKSISTILITLMSCFCIYLLDTNTIYSCPQNSILPWSYGGWIRVNLTDSCYYEIEYCYRDPHEYYQDTNYYDVWFGEIRFFGNCDNFMTYFDNDPQNFFLRAYESLLVDTNAHPWRDTIITNNGDTIIKKTNFLDSIPDCDSLENYTARTFCRKGMSACYGSYWSPVYWDPNGSPELGVWYYYKLPCNIDNEEIGCWETCIFCRRFNSELQRYELVLTQCILTQGAMDCPDPNCTFICR